MTSTYRNKNILITGAGSIGEGILNSLPSSANIRLFDNSEIRLHDLRLKHTDKNIKYIIGDVRDRDAVQHAMEDIDVVFHCLLPDTTIITDGLNKPISELKKNDGVLTHRGRFQKIEKILKRKINDEIIEIKPWMTNITIKVTKEHPILIWKPNKKCPYSYRKFCNPACKMKIRGSCPKHYEKDSLRWAEADEIREGDFIVYPRLKNIGKIDLHTDLFRLIGYYLSEGCLGSKIKGKYYSVRFSFGSHEDELILDVQNIIKKIYGKSSSIYETSRNGKTVTVCSYKIAEFFRQFGTHSFNKHIPNNYLLSSSDKQAKNLLTGYFLGDGCINNGKISTISKQLAYQVRILYQKIGVYVGLQKYGKKNTIINGRRYNNNYPTYQISISKNFDFISLSNKPKYRSFCWVDDEYIYVQIRAIKKIKYEGYVYNLTIAEDNTYCSEGIVTHNCAALKHVSFCEENPYAAVKTNIIGTQNVIDAAKHVEKLINISTDKAANPINVMGSTKLITERLVRHAGFTSIRLGNVFASNGSVVEIFKHQIKNGKPVTITDSKMTRFIISIEEAVDFILQSSFLSKGRDIFILKMPAFSITDLALAISEDVEMKTIGKYSVEKLHEILMTEEEIEHAYENEAMIVLLPDETHAKYYEEQGFKKIKKPYPDSSYVKQLTIEDIKKLL